MDAEEKKPPSVDTSGLGLDNSDASEITFQSAKRGLSIEEIEQSNTAHIGGTTARRLTDPRSQTYQPSNNHIDTIIKLKLQVAQQKEMIDSLTLDLNNALSEKKAILSKAVSLTLDLNHEFSEKNKAILSKAKKQPAKTFTLASLAEEKAHSDNSRSLYEQYNELQEKLAAVEAENTSLRNERNMLQSRLAKMSSKVDESNTTANLTDYSESSGCELMSDDLLHPGFQTRRANSVGQSHRILAHDSYLPWSEVKRRSSEPTAYSRRQRGKPKSSEWFIGDESESNFLSKMFSWNKGTKSTEEQEKVMQGYHRRSSMPDKMTSKTKPHQPNRRPVFKEGKNESYRKYVQSEQNVNDSHKNISWGDSDSS